MIFARQEIKIQIYFAKRGMPDYFTLCLFSTYDIGKMSFFLSPFTLYKCCCWSVYHSEVSQGPGHGVNSKKIYVVIFNKHKLKTKNVINKIVTAWALGTQYTISANQQGFF